MIRKVYLWLVLAVLTLVVTAPASASMRPGAENRTGVFDLVGGLCVGVDGPEGGEFVGGNGGWGYDVASRSTLAARGGHIGASGSAPGRQLLINASGRTDNCVAGVCAAIRNRMARTHRWTADLIESRFGYTGASREFVEADALAYVERATGLTASPKPVPFMASSAPARHYVIILRRGHIVYGRVLPNGTRYIYDPQIGRRLSWAQMVSKWGPGRPFLLQ